MWVQAAYPLCQRDTPEGGFLILQERSTHFCSHRLLSLYHSGARYQPCITSLHLKSSWSALSAATMTGTNSTSVLSQGTLALNSCPKPPGGCWGLRPSESQGEPLTGGIGEIASSGDAVVGIAEPCKLQELSAGL